MVTFTLLLVADCKSNLSNQMINLLRCFLFRDLMESTVHTVILAPCPALESCCLATDRKKDRIPGHCDDEDIGGP